MNSKEYLKTLNLFCQENIFNFLSSHFSAKLREKCYKTKLNIMRKFITFFLKYKTITSLMYLQNFKSKDFSFMVSPSLLNDYI